MTANHQPGTLRTYLLGLFVCLAALCLHGYLIVRPAMFDDDFQLIVKSWTWSAAWHNLWLPHNEHVEPLGRLSVAALVELAGGRPSAMLRATAWQGPLAVVLGMVLVGVFVKREMGHAFYGLVAMILFGLSQKYNEAVFWFAASFTLLALDTTLLALLAAQRWRQTGRWRDLVLCGVWCGLAPAWFASGVLAGPLCVGYLLPFDRWRQRVPELLRALVPLIGTVAFLTSSVLLASRPVDQVEHHGGRSLWEVCNPVLGLELTARTLVDNLIFGVFAATGAVASNTVLLLALAGLVIVGAWWWSVATQRRLMFLGLDFVFLSYGLIYSFREGWSYDQQMVGWTRYNLFPYLGLVFFLCGGLPSRQGSLFQLDPGGTLTRGQSGALALLTAVLVTAQMPLTVAGHQAKNPDPEPQRTILKHIEAVDARCKEFHIDAATARQALGEPLILPQCKTEPPVDGWELLRGSDEPTPHTVEEVRRLLLPESPTPSR